MTHPYPLEWDSVPYPPKFKPPMLHTYDGKGSPNQHIYYFRSQIDNIIDNDTIMAKLFIGTLKGITFDWFKSLPSGSINSWIDLETRFLSQFYEDDTEVTIDKLLSMVQKGREFVWEYIEMFHDLSLMYPAGMSLPMLLQTCQHNFLDRIEVHMGLLNPIHGRSLLSKPRLSRSRLRSLSPQSLRTRGGPIPRGVM